MSCCACLPLGRAIRSCCRQQVTDSKQQCARCTAGCAVFFQQPAALLLKILLKSCSKLMHPHHPLVG
jgi:hypothetical protein